MSLSADPPRAGRETCLVLPASVREASGTLTIGFLYQNALNAQMAEKGKLTIL